MKKFEERLGRLEELSDAIRDPELALEDALAFFEEGIKLAKNLEKDLDKIEGKIQILMNQPTTPDEKPELDLFSQEGAEGNETRTGITARGRAQDRGGRGNRPSRRRCARTPRQLDRLERKQDIARDHGRRHRSNPGNRQRFGDERGRHRDLRAHPHDEQDLSRGRPPYPHHARFSRRGPFLDPGGEQPRNNHDKGRARSLAPPVGFN